MNQARGVGTWGDDAHQLPQMALRLPSPPREALQPLAQYLDALLRRPRRRDSVGCEGRHPALPSGAVPARSLVDSRSAGSSRSSAASLCSRRPCPASSTSVRASRLCECRIRCPSRLSSSPFARNRTTVLRLSSSRPVSAPESPVFRSWRDPILTDLLKLNAAFTIFAPDVMAGERWKFF